MFNFYLIASEFLILDCFFLFRYLSFKNCSDCVPDFICSLKF